MLKTILIDDEQRYTDEMEKELQKCCAADVEVIAKCNTAIDGLKAIKNLRPDLVFLDVEMPDASGFEVLELASHTDFEVIFFTNHVGYAMQAFEYSAVHYLWKPSYISKLGEAIERVKQRKKQGAESKKEQMEVLTNNLKPENKKIIGFSNGEGYDFIPMEAILYFEADGNFIFVYLSDKRRLHTLRSIGQMEEMLRNDREFFFRIHSKYMINKDYLLRYKRGDGGEAIMTNGKSLPVARARKREFLDWLGLNDPG